MIKDIIDMFTGVLEALEPKTPLEEYWIKTFRPWKLEKEQRD